MTRKNIILSGVLSFLILIVGLGCYFGFHYYQIKQEENMKLFIEKKNKECYDLVSPLNVQRIKLSKGEDIKGQFYSKKSGSCLYYAIQSDSSIDNPHAGFVLKEILTNNIVEQIVFCDGKDDCAKFVNLVKSGSIDNNEKKILGENFIKLIDSYR